MSDLPIIEWTIDHVKLWLENEGFKKRDFKFPSATVNGFDRSMHNCVYDIFDYHCIDGKTLMSINDYDFKCEPLNKLLLSDRKKLQISLKCLQRENHSTLIALGVVEPGCLTNCIGLGLGYTSQRLSNEGSESYGDSDRVSPPVSVDGRSSELKPEIWKAGLSIAYAFLVMWITSLVMVLVHDRVPDMKIYPPLPDIVLDNVPHIPLAFTLCEVLGTVLALIWFCVLVVHKHRMILIRRFFALAGTVFLLRCITMLITSLSVPGTHLKCEPRDTPAELVNGSFYDELQDKISRAFIIWRGGGLSIRGVRTCGDYMFSGHTVALTLLNFFITEYTDSNYLHIVTWILNLFGVFFILAAHEHYSIDVFIAFYITSRLFLYYHTLANNQALMQRDSTRTRIWFPMFSYFESSVDGIVPNEYHSLYDIVKYFIKNFLYVKKLCVKYLKILIRKIVTFSNIFLQQTTYPRNRRIDVGTDNISNENVNKKFQ